MTNRNDEQIIPTAFTCPYCHTRQVIGVTAYHSAAEELMCGTCMASVWLSELDWQEEESYLLALKEAAGDCVLVG
jgi:transcription elongation factor Elf1